jgi:hypothetical protein
MTTTIAAGFDKLKSNLEITALQSATVSTRQLLLRETIEKGFGRPQFVSGRLICPINDDCAAERKRCRYLYSFGPEILRAIQARGAS